MSKTSDRVEAARKLVTPAAEDFVHTALDRVGPLAEAAAEALGSAAEKVSPYAHSAADRLGPLAQNAAEHLGPLAGQARDRVSPYASQAAAAVSPYAATAVGAVGPLAHQAAEKITPLADAAWQRGAQAAHDARERFGPAFDDARDRVGPAVDSARERVSAELLPKLTGALSVAAGAPIVTEAVNRGQATLAAARGDLTFLPPKKKGSWIKRIAIVAGLAALAYVLARKLLGSKDSDWQAARPTTPYAPPQPAATDVGSKPESSSIFEPAAETLVAPVDESAEAGDEPQSGPSAHSSYLEANGEAEPDQPAEGGEAEAIDALSETEDRAVEPETVELEAEAEAEDDTFVEPEPDTVVEPEDNTFSEPEDSSFIETDNTVFIQAVSDPEPTADPEPATDRKADEAEGAAPSDSSAARWLGAGGYVGDEPPEGFVIKGNERSMKYHVPESSGYVRTIAEVWFDSEEAAQAAGFVHAQR